MEKQFKSFPLYFCNNKRGVLDVPPEMTQEDYDLLKRQIDSALWVISETGIFENADSSPLEPPQ
jgi:hypothetical protein